jgi:small conductance mechanosensitive channel
MENWEQTVVKIQELITLYGLRILAAIAILIVGRIAASIVRGAVQRGMRRTKVDDTLIAFVSSLTYWGVLAFIIIAALAQLGIQTASFIAIIGAAGLAIGLALQGSLSNFASGVLMIIFKPFVVGNYVEAGGTSGIVEEIGIFTTEMRTPDNKKVIVPNAQITSTTITNYSAKDTRRLDLVAGVSYGDDIDKVKKVLRDIYNEDERFLREPEVTIGLLELADSSVNFAFRPWVKTSDYWPVYFDTMEKIKKRFDAEGINIPFPQQDVHLFQEK